MQAASGSGDGGLSGEVLLRRAGEVPLTPRRKIHGRERNAFEPSFESIPAGSAIAHRWCTHGESLIHAPARSGQFMCDRKRSIQVRAQAVDSSKRYLRPTPTKTPDGLLVSDFWDRAREICGSW